MTTPKTVTVVEQELARRRRRLRPVYLAIAALLLALALAAVLGLVAAIGLLHGGTPAFDSEEEHFLHGSIGAETASGLPYDLWRALPVLFPEAFAGRRDYTAFGFLNGEDETGRSDLPIGISRRTRLGIDLVWFNCAVCHAGTYRVEDGAERRIVAGMPANNFDLNRFIGFLLEAATSPRLAPDEVFAAVRETGGRLGPIDRLVWRYFVIPTVREELLRTRAALRPLLGRQPAWGPGRVDTFNPYKAVQMEVSAGSLTEIEVIGASDFPSIFLQGPREGMQLHWDGNNDSLAERNLSAALGAGVTPETIDHAAVRRVARWLAALEPPPSPHRPDPDAVKRGETYYRNECSACHGYNGAGGYEFDGAKIGTVEDIAEVGTDRHRLDSYTEAFRRRQLDELFAGTPYQFKRFRKTNGYANMPLDGLWLRGPYLHNGSVPTLADLLNRPDERPAAFVRGIDILDATRGGFRSPPCTAGAPIETGFCFDTRQPGNGNGGHFYGTELPPEKKADLLAYLLTF